MGHDVDVDLFFDWFVSCHFLVNPVSLAFPCSFALFYVAPGKRSETRQEGRETATVYVLAKIPSHIPSEDRIPFVFRHPRACEGVHGGEGGYGKQ